MHLTSPGSGPSARFVLKCVIQDERSLDQHKFRQNVDARKCSRPDTSRVEVHCQEIGRRNWTHLFSAFCYDLIHDAWTDALVVGPPEQDWIGRDFLSTSSLSAE
jgi:hypothetical protein